MQPEGAHFGDLPVELVEEVAEVCRGDSLALALVSKLFNAVATRIIYRRLKLEAPDTLIGALKTLAGNPLAAQSVKTLSIATTSQKRFKSFYTLLERAISGCENVTSLGIASSLPEYGPLLRKCTFPKLEAFHYLSIDEDVVEFLRRHPRITNLYLTRSPHDSSVECPYAPLTLPRLTALVCSSSAMPLFVSTSPLQAVHVVWDSTEFAHMDATMQVLGTSTAPVGLFATELEAWSEPLLRSVANHLARIDTLIISNSTEDLYADEAYDSFVNVLLEVLPNFSRLQRLKLAAGCGQNPVASIYTMCDDYTMSTKLGRACPTLETCQFITEIPFDRHRWGIWLPDAGFPRISMWYRHFMFSTSSPLRALSAEILEGFLSDARNEMEYLLARHALSAKSVEAKSRTAVALRSENDIGAYL
ncbi:hypothetical protein OE88DRAFT_1732472 [Heliocybe sulcata]|uniref:F-box domain-containing protein n=1 Tax=Heliocybe sulcata TaxID=5364 RepID=A0A5C3NC10_9AGAM|nr:hypothetical protein OE88DRAFT_1732472 [Heliocybe sulcata]